MDSESSENTRSKRRKIDKHGRGAAFERLKGLKEKGVKNKYEVDTIDNVYEEVDEREYTKKVLQRQDDDWIVDDDGSGYVEDGREIFDDDLDEASVASAKKKTKRNLSKNIEKTSSQKSNILNMFANMPTKRKAEDIKTEEDDVLSELMSEIDDVPNAKMQRTPRPSLEATTKHSLFDSEKEAEKKYLNKFSKPQPIKKTKLNEVVAKPYPTVNPTKAEKVEPVKKITEPLINESGGSLKIEDATHEESLKSSDYEIQTPDSNSIPEGFFDDDCFEKDDEDEDAAGKLLDKISNEAESIKENTKKDLNKIIDFDWNDNFDKPVTDNKVKNDPKNLELKEFSVTTDEKTSFRFFWWDAYEDPYKSGTIFLFGKVYHKQLKKYLSCCVAVKNIERKIYILPRTHRFNLKTNTETEEKVSMLDVYNEFNSKFANNIVFRSRPVTKSYCFDIENIPSSAEYLEIRYPAEKGRLLKSDTPSETFQHVFGTDSNVLEIFLLDRKLKGPCWLDITGCTVETNPVSWCQVNVACNKMADITIVKAKEDLQTPPISLVAINVKTVENPKTKKNEIVMIAWMSHSSYNLAAPKTNPPYEQYYCAITHPSDQMWTYEHNELLKSFQNKKVERCPNERSLLNYFLAIFLNQDPDLIVGHDLIGYQLDILFQQICHQKIQNWSRLGKLRRKIYPQRIRNIQVDAVPGRLVCDIKISAQELVKCRSYDLNTLCEEILHVQDDQRLEIRSEQVRGFYEIPQGLKKLINATMQDTTYILKMMYELNAIPLAVQITNISGFILSRTLLGGRSERNEYLLLHAFDNRDYIVPDKFGSLKYEDNNETKVEPRKKAAYAGGLVLEPQIGWYDEYILLMDFNSLYPSIIQEYNICFTSNVKQNEDGSWTIEGNVPNPVLPTEIRKLVESRRQVKILMKAQNIQPEQYQKYNIRQMALKLTANSMYGCLGFSKSRFYSQNLAAMITQFGREILSETKYLVEKQCYNVVYGDTDSLMINTKLQDFDEVYKIGYKIKKEVNRKYKHVELDIDGVFKFLLLVRKKKYAALTVSKNKNGTLAYKQEIKGLDIVRRDWSRLASEAGKFIINTLFDDTDKDSKFIAIIDHLNKLKNDIENDRVPLSLFAITKQLTKDPNLYADKKSNPHVLVAIRHNAKSGSKKFRQGDSIYYIICDDGTDLPPMQRAYHVEEVKDSSELKVDSKYYLSQQIYPIVSRICQPIEGFDLVEIANSLGLDGSSIKKSHKNLQGDATWQNNEYRKFSNVDPFKFKCLSCSHVTEIDEFKAKTVNFEVCENKQCDTAPVSYPSSIQNQLVLQIRDFIKRYYDFVWTCDVPGCEVVFKGVPNTTFTKKKIPECPCGEGVLYSSYSDMNLYKQILYFYEIFGTAGEKKRTPDTEIIFKNLQMVTNKYLQENAWGIIDIGSLFTLKTNYLKKV